MHPKAHFRRKLYEYYQHCILLEPTEIIVADTDRQFLEAAMATGAQHLTETDFGVVERSAVMVMNQSAVYRRLRSLMSQTAAEFIRDMHLKRAAQLLVQSQLRILKIASEVCIADTNDFRKIFQKRVGQKPFDYAQQHRASPHSLGRGTKSPGKRS